MRNVSSALKSTCHRVSAIIIIIINKYFHICPYNSLLR